MVFSMEAIAEIFLSAQQPWSAAAPADRALGLAEVPEPQ